MLINEIIFFILPVLIAGIIHHFIIIHYNLLSPLAIPIDGGQKIFGRSKTWRGFIIMIFLIALIIWILSYFINIQLAYNIFLSGAIIGLGYSLGELPTSFIKRRLGIAPSNSAYHSWKKLLYGLDQIDSVIGSIIALIIVYNPSNELIWSIFIVGTLLHLIVDSLLHNFGYKKY